MGKAAIPAVLVPWQEVAIEVGTKARIEFMRLSTCGQIQTSVLGFGCGSVLGRVGRGPSLRAMHAAWDAGITLFDTARSYGYGDAEQVLGEFLRGKRDRAIVATKFGITAQNPGRLKRAAVPIARALINLKIPGVHSLARRGGAERPQFGDFTREGLRASLETSLRQLRTDYVDILFLHEASSSALCQQDLMGELDALILAGKVRRAGLYASAEVVAEGLLSGPATLSAMQFGANSFDRVATGMGRLNRRSALLIGNHPFGTEQRVAAFTLALRAIASDETVPTALREKLGNPDWQLVLEAILGVALSGMGVHALVFSMMRGDHLRANLRAIEGSCFTASELTELAGRILPSNKNRLQNRQP
jgi:aryl-alcohol dehydrogenase-like predicted oxidoreductase